MNEREFAQLNNNVFSQNEKIIIRIPILEDIRGYLEVLKINDSSLRLLLEANAEDTEWWIEGYYKTLNNTSSENLHLSIIDKKSGSYMGELAVQGYMCDVPEIGITLLEPYRNKGIAAEIINIYMKQCKKIHNVLYFAARIDKENVASLKMISKLSAEKRMQIQNWYCYMIK